MNFNHRVVLAALAFSLVPETVRAQAPQPPQPPQRSITALTENVYRAQNNIHFTVFLVTPEGIILADPINRDFSSWLKGELDQRFGVPVRYVLYSHHHWDHASGGAVFADTAQFVGHENMLPHLALPAAGTALPEAARAMDTNGDGHIGKDEATANFQSNFALFDADGDGSLSGAEVTRGPLSDVRVPELTFAQNHVVSLGGQTAEMTWTGAVTHTDDMAVIRFPGEGVVYVVDFISIKAMPYRTLGNGLLDEWLDAIRMVEAMEFRIVSPGHGVVGQKADVAEHRGYIETLRQAVQAGVDTGQSVEQLKESVQLDQYKDWFMYDAWRAENVQGMYNLLTAAK